MTNISVCGLNPERSFRGNGDRMQAVYHERAFQFQLCLTTNVGEGLLVAFHEACFGEG